jgi:hypothetical protein
MFWAGMSWYSVSLASWLNEEYCLTRLQHLDHQFPCAAFTTHGDNRLSITIIGLLSLDWAQKIDVLYSKKNCKFFL